MPRERLDAADGAGQDQDGSGRQRRLGQHRVRTPMGPDEAHARGPRAVVGDGIPGLGIHAFLRRRTKPTRASAAMRSPTSTAGASFFTLEATLSLSSAMSSPCTMRALNRPTVVMELSSTLSATRKMTA